MKKWMEPPDVYDTLEMEKRQLKILQMKREGQAFMSLSLPSSSRHQPGKPCLCES